MHLADVVFLTIGLIGISVASTLFDKPEKIRKFIIRTFTGLLLFYYCFGQYIY